MKELDFRCSTIESIEQLSKELHLIFDPDDLQDWEYRVGNPKEIERYISHYKTLDNDDKKFSLMEIIIQAATDQHTSAEVGKYWTIIEPILKQNSAVHDYSIFYWCCFDNPDVNDCWDITPYMRDLWKKMNQS
ncbi:hypothetical protein NAT51_12270 [Flavobacterium amniphilum]|uniref:hypothetical protein n=1 Tax=Flavobacterium amniphilum TaxID=1834035 RepID=UPI002029E682|nr:hypothetical protein [Flavobacterium amniphilum]MCL9806304.1 hypothetical protein [Flavobacterium amniphilum]